jgi:hypothetical protein
MQYFDADGSGSLSFDEFLQMLRVSFLMTSWTGEEDDPLTITEIERREKNLSLTLSLYQTTASMPK